MLSGSGLMPSDINIITEILAEYPAIQRAVVFGSRAKKNHHRGSDIDVALFGDEITDITTEIAGRLNEESPLPYFFDIIDYNTLSHRALREHIDRVGIEFYARPIES